MILDRSYNYKNCFDLSMSLSIEYPIITIFVIIITIIMMMMMTIIIIIIIIQPGQCP